MTAKTLEEYEIHTVDHGGCHSSADGTVHICGGDEEQSDWFLTTKRWPAGWNHKVYVDCCNRFEFPRNTEGQFYSAFSGYVAGYRFRCAPNKGCNKNPGYLRTAHLRFYEFAS